MDKQYKYDAFISYRHMARDKAIAGKLQKMLESYKPPKSVTKDFKQWHIFRDETELPTSSNLSQDIRDALDNSRFLIVVCSKETKESRWCMEEITYFKDIHKGNNSNIITLIVDGEPSEVFPPELCNEIIEVTDAQGNVSYQSHVIEPLAANVAASTTKGSLKKLNTEFLRIAAPLLGCGYDTLYNRNHKRYIRRIFTIAALVTLFLLGFSVYTGAMLFEINAQKTALQLANESLEAKTKELDKKNKELKTTNNNLKKKTKEAQENLAEANRQKNVAQKQRKIAEQNAAEANRQKQIAQNNLAEANKQRKIAEQNAAEADRQRIIAEENAAEADRQRIIAEENLNEANHQRAIAEKNLEEANRQRAIAEENEAKALEQTRLAQIENSENLASISKTLWDSGEGVKAVETILSALPGEGESRPVVPTAEKILANELGAFCQSSFLPVKTLNHNMPVDMVKYAGKGKTLVTRDKTGVYFWDVESEELKNKYTFDNSFELIVSVEGDKVIETSSIVNSIGSTLAYDEENRLIYGYKKVGSETENAGKGDVLIFADGLKGEVLKVNGETGELIWKKSLAEDDYLYEGTILPDGNLALDYYDDVNNSVMVKILDGKTGEIISNYSASDIQLRSFASGKWLSFGKNKCYYNVKDGNETSIIAFDIKGNSLSNPEIIFFYGDKNSYHSSKVLSTEVFGDTMVNVVTYANSVLKENAALCGYEHETGKLKWTYDFGNINSEIGFSGMLYAKDTHSYCDMIFGVVSDKMVLLDAKDGSLIYEYMLGGNVNDMYYSRDGMVYLLTQSGAEYAVPLRGLNKDIFSDKYYSGVFCTHEFVAKPEKTAYSNGTYALVHKNSNQTHIYTDVTNNDFKVLYKNDSSESNSSVRINNSGTYAAVCCYDYFAFCDIRNGTVKEVKTEEVIFKYDFLDETHLFAQCKDQIYIYDITTGNCVYSDTGEKYRYMKEGNVLNNKLVIDNDKNVEFLSKDGTREIWSPEYQDKGESGKTVNPTIFDISISDNTKLAAKLWAIGWGDRIEVYDLATKKSVPLEDDLADLPFKAIEYDDMVWICDNHLVLHKNNVLLKYDGTTGKYLGKTTLSLPGVQALIPLGDESQLGVICADSRLYRINLDTGIITGTINLKNDLVLNVQITDFESRLVKNKNMLILQENTYNVGYIIDLITFKLRYEMLYYQDYSEGINSIAVNEYSTAGLYPLYTTNQLINKVNLK